MAAISGIDQALWDIRAKALGVPLFELLGGPIRERVHTYRNLGSELGGASREPAAWTAATLAAMDAGFDVSIQIALAIPNFLTLELVTDDAPWRGEVVDGAPQRLGGHATIGNGRGSAPTWSRRSPRAIPVGGRVLTWRQVRTGLFSTGSR
jgi:L-alanine-DL-glutamate epimerase-like enolase superfamily enzyme